MILSRDKYFEDIFYNQKVPVAFRSSLLTLVELTSMHYTEPKARPQRGSESSGKGTHNYTGMQNRMSTTQMKLGGDLEKGDDRAADEVIAGGQ